MATRTIVSHPIQAAERYLGKQTIERLKSVGVTVITAAITVAWGVALITQTNYTTGHDISRTSWDHPRRPSLVVNRTGTEPTVESSSTGVSPVDLSSTTLAANPELALARRYTAMVEWRKLHHLDR